MKHPAGLWLAWYALSAFLALTAACGSGISAGGVHSADYEKYLLPPHGAPYRRRPDVLLAAPKQPYVVVGLIEVRTSRPKAVDVLVGELKEQGFALQADAVIPGGRAATADSIAAGAGAYRPYYVFDDGSHQVLEALAIRYPY